jgi:hypothetical protein
MEFKEYASEVDVEFVRKSVRAIGRCAIKIDKAAERSVVCICPPTPSKQLTPAPALLLAVVQLHPSAVGADSDQSELCGAGGHYCHQSEWPALVRCCCMQTNTHVWRLVVVM